MTSESERTSCEPAAASPARTFIHATDMPENATRAVNTSLYASLQSCPEVRVRAVTEPSPKAVFRHIDIHGPPPRDRWNRRQFVFLNATSTIERSQS